MCCYVGKATKIFIFIVTVLVISGLVLGFRLFRRTIQKHSHNCDGDSCPSSPLVYNPNTPPFPSSSSPSDTPPSPPVGSNQPNTSPNPPTLDDPNPPPQFAAPPLPVSSAVLAVPPYNQPTPVLVAPGPVHA